MQTPTLDVIYDLIAERGKQIAKGKTAAHDAADSPAGQLVDAAMAYATGNAAWWPYRALVRDKLAQLDRRTRLVRAAALLVAEIERIDHIKENHVSKS